MNRYIELLAYRARFQRDSIALQAPDKRCTFAELHTMVKRLGGHLAKAGVRPGQVVVTAIADKYFDWIMTLALTHEAALTCSNHGHGPVESLEYDWIVTGRPMPHFPSDKTIVFDTAWIQAAYQDTTERPAQHYASDQDFGRLIMTSGTTGQHKVVPLAFGPLFTHTHHSLALDGPVNAVTMMSLATTGGFGKALQALVAGTPLPCANTPREALELVDRMGLDGLYGSPMQLAAAVQEKQATGLSLRSLRRVMYGGSVGSPTFVSSVEQHLTPHIVNMYGSTEARSLSLTWVTSQSDLNNVGTPIPDSAFEVVDETGAVVPAGTEGLVRARSPNMAREYYRDPAATAQSFRDGWFYSGDRGQMMPDGSLQLLGRDSEMINRGGVKIDPVLLDHFIQGFAGVADGAVFGVENRLGIQDLAAVMVVPEQFDFNALRQGFSTKFGTAYTPSFFIRVDQVPRNAMGKVMRAHLTRQLGPQLLKPSREPA